MTEESLKERKISDYKGLWIFAEHNDGKLMNIALELLGAGRKLADDLDVPLSAVVLGDADDMPKQLIHFGADQVYVIEHPLLKQYQVNAYTKALVRLIEKHLPEIVLFGATSTGRELAPRVAARLGIGLSADCIDLRIDNRLLVQSKPAFGGNIMATIIIPNHRPQMATIRPNVMKPLEPQTSREGEIIHESDIYLKAEDLYTAVIDVIRETDYDVKLEEAKAIVSGGYGLGKPENFKILKELADVIGGAVGASRAAVDADWISSSHLVGMQTSEIIVAINKDPNAPIFNIATYGIVGDLMEIVPAITKVFREKLGIKSK